MISDLLDDLTTSGWTISWAFQFSADEWRMSIIREADIGAEQGTYLSHCASAPSFESALEDCLPKRNDAEFTPSEAPTWSIDTAPEPKLDLSLLGLRPKVKIERRI